MEQIFVESSKSYYHGFILKEQDLRRFIDLINEQFKKLSNNPIQYEFKIKYKNGAVANTTDFESILKQENEGSSSIVRLGINGSLKSEGKESIIKLDFKNPELSDDESDIPIKHLIKGQSRDWVFVTSSLIEERVAKIKRRQFEQTSSKGLGKLLYKLFAPLLVTLVVLILTLANISETVQDLSSQRDVAISKLEKKWKNKQITDPIEVIFQMEKVKNNAEDKLPDGFFYTIFLSKPILIFIGISILITLLALFIVKYYPLYNFCWGNYVEIFAKKESTRKLIVGLLLGTITLGVIVNLISNVIWEKI